MDIYPIKLETNGLVYSFRWGMVTIRNPKRHTVHDHYFGQGYIRSVTTKPSAKHGHLFEIQFASDKTQNWVLNETDCRHIDVLGD